VVERWRDRPRWQYFSGCAYDEDRLLCDATTLVKSRQLLGEEGVEELLAQTINVALKLKRIEPQELSRVIIDSMVQEKAIAHPTDSRLLEVARSKRVTAAQAAGIKLKQTFAPKRARTSPARPGTMPITAWTAVTLNPGSSRENQGFCLLSTETVEKSVVKAYKPLS